MTQPIIDPRLAGELRRLRKAAGMSAEEAARKLGCSPSKISRAERMRAGVTIRDMHLMLDIYGVDDDVRKVLAAIAERSSGAPRGTVDAYRDEADTADIWAPFTVPSPLRTPEYALAVATTVQDITMALPSEAHDTAAVSRAWLRRIQGSRRPIKIRAVLDGAVLMRRPITAGRQVMLRQVEHLAGLAARTNVEIRMLPLGGVPVDLAAFTLLGFGEEDLLPDILLFDDAAWPRIADAEIDTYRARRAFSLLFDRSTEPQALIEQALGKW